MRPYIRINLALLSGVALLLGIALFQEHQEAPLGEEQEEAFSSATGRPHRIQIQTRTGANLLLLREESGWFMRRPLRGPADAVRVEHLLEIFKNTEQEAITTPRELSVYGLEKPRLIFQVDQTRVSFGDRNPLTGERYLARGGHVFLARDRIVPQMESSHPELLLITQEPVPGNFALQSIHSSRWHIARGAEGWFFLTPREKYPPTAAREIAKAWLNARATTVSHWSAFATREAGEEAQAGEASEVLLESADGQRLRYSRLSRRGEPLILGVPRWGIRFHFNAGNSAAMLMEDSAGAP